MIEASTRIDELIDSINEIDQLTITIDDEKTREDERILEATTRLESARAQADLLSNELAELNRNAAASRDAPRRLKFNGPKPLARVSFVRESCANELNQSLDEIAGELTLDAEFDLEAKRAEVEDLRNRLENFGAVNMMALEELSEADERLVFLTTQREDITNGIAATEEALREIKRRSRERFRDAFEKINRISASYSRNCSVAAAAR